MATAAGTLSSAPVDRVSRATDGGIVRAIDRWIYVFMAVLFIVITLVGFIPDSITKVAAVNAGERPPFPAVLHMHAVLMGSFLLLLLAQTTLAALGRCDLHRRLGIAGLVLAPAIVVVGFILVPTSYQSLAAAAHHAPAAKQAMFQQRLLVVDDIMLMQLRIGILFAALIFVGIKARGRNAGVHKRLMILAPAMALPAAIDRMEWLPSTFPASATATDLYTLAAVSPMFLWDLYREHGVHRAYVLWLALFVPTTLLVHGLWDQPWWHSVAPHVMGL